MSPNSTLTGQPTASEYLRSKLPTSDVALTDSSRVSRRLDPSDDTETMFTAGPDASSSLP